MMDSYNTRKAPSEVMTADPHRSNLLVLAEEFNRLAKVYLPMYHELLAHPNENGDPITTEDGLGPPKDNEEVWRAFITTHKSAGDQWQEWHGPHIWSRVRRAASAPILSGAMPPNFIREHDRHEHISWCGRFHGHEDGLEEFKQLADSLTRVMAPILDPLLVICGWANALLVLHSAAWKHPTPLVRAEEAAWDGEPASSGESDRQRRASKGRKNRRAFPLHIRRWSLQNNLFVVARETIRQLINPRSALLIEESQTASQLLPPLDELFRVGVIATDSDSPDEETNSEVSVDRPVASELRPQWDRVKRKLWFGSILLRHFGKVAASTQMPILDEFQRTGWQQAIRCKFPESTTPDSQRLDAVRHLNASLLDQNQIHFYNDGSGAICWGTGPTSNRRQTRRGTKSQKPS